MSAAEVDGGRRARRFMGFPNADTDVNMMIMPCTGINFLYVNYIAASYMMAVLLPASFILDGDPAAFVLFKAKEYLYKNYSEPLAKVSVEIFLNAIGHVI